MCIDVLSSTMFTIADSIGIKLVSNNCLLTGIGNELHQYYIDEEAVTHHRQINLNFHCKIYGISSEKQNNSENPQFVIVYGGKEAAVLTVTKNNKINIIKTLSLNDWISSVHVYKSELSESDQISFCVLSAHSVATEIEINQQGDWKVLNRSSCIDKCTLYCSKIVGDRWLETVIFGGNAFGELIVWTVGKDSQPRNVIHRLTGHNGVIFSIDCSLQNNLLTTTSDDRSVQIWNIKFESNESYDWSKCMINASKSMFGHTARIFNHRIIEYNGNLFIVTIGEEGNLCIWSLEGQLLNRELIANDVSLWNLDYDSERHNLLISGKDGNVHQMHIKHILDGEKYSHSTISFSKAKDEFITKIVTVSCGSMLVALSNNQSLYYRKIGAEVPDEWNYFGTLSGYKSTLLESIDNIVATAGYEFSTFYRYDEGQFKQIFHKKLSSGLIRSLKFVRSNEFIICDDRGNCRFCSLDTHTFQVDENIDFELPPSKERWITVAFRSQNFLLIGDRCGHIHLYEINATNRTVTLCHTLKSVHGNLGCTSIHQQTENDKIVFKTSGHDGTLKTLVINENNRTLEIHFTYTVPIGWCDKILSLGNDALLLAGFNDNHFVTSQNDNSFRFEFECGGGHRYWDVYIDTNRMIAFLFYIRSKTIHSVRFNLNRNKMHSFVIAKSNWHSRPCNIVRTIQLPHNRHLLVSGGDDNLLKFNEIDVSSNEQKTVTDRALPHHIIDMVLHISNIRTIYLHRLLLSTDDSEYENWLIFSAGGRAQICVTEIQFGHQQQLLQFREINNFMLRSSDLQRKRWGKSKTIDFDPETRFMSLISYSRESENDICLIAACSDGYLRCFSYKNGDISLICSTYYGRCILHVHHFQFENRNYLISMATDGRIVYWGLDDFHNDVKPLKNNTLQHHDSGINSFDAFIDEKKRLFIATGGDDQAVVISILQIKHVDNILDVSVLKTERFPNEHTAQVNGVKFSIKDQALYTASVDQTIMRIDLKNFQAKQVAYTCVSDAKGIQMIDDKSVLVYGCGAQLINVKN